MENKVHVTLHKVKKHWVALAVSSLALATVIGASPVKADELQEASGTPLTQTLLTPEESQTELELHQEDSQTVETPAGTDNQSSDYESDQDLKRPLDGQGITGGQFQSDEQGNWSYVDQDGQELKGWQTVDYHQLFFYPDGTQAKDAFIILDGDTYYFQKDSGQMAKNSFVSDSDGNWYYFDQEGRMAKGAQTIDNFELYFHPDGQQAKGEIVTIDSKDFYYDQDNGRKVTNTSLTIDGKAYSADAEGVLRPETAIITGGSFQSDEQGNWYYYTAEGEKLTGFQNIDGLVLYFDADGKQAKGGPVVIDGKTYYFDQHNGSLQTNQWVSWQVGYGDRWANFIGSVNGYLTQDGSLAKGWQTIDGKDYYFNDQGQRVENNIATIDGQRYVFDQDGQVVKNGSYTVQRRSWLGTLSFTYLTDDQGIVIAEL